jgi:hypothetical protein
MTKTRHIWLIHLGVTLELAFVLLFVVALVYVITSWEF